MENQIAAFVNLTSTCKTLTTKKRIAKQLLGSRHPIVAQLRAEQRAARKARALIAPEFVTLSQVGPRAALVQEHGVDEGIFADAVVAATNAGLDDIVTVEMLMEGLA